LLYSSFCKPALIRRLRLRAFTRGAHQPVYKFSLFSRTRRNPALLLVALRPTRPSFHLFSYCFILLSANRLFFGDSVSAPSPGVLTSLFIDDFSMVLYHFFELHNNTNTVLKHHAFIQLNTVSRHILNLTAYNARDMVVINHFYIVQCMLIRTRINKKTIFCFSRTYL